MVSVQVAARLRLLLNSTLAHSSQMVYKRAYKLLHQGMLYIEPHFNICTHLPMSQNRILFFIAFLSVKGLAAATITTYVSAVGYMHKILNFTNPTCSFMVQKVLAAVNKVSPSVDSRLPITLLILHQLIQAASSVISSPFHAQLTKAMFLVAFYGLMRVGEIAYSSASKNPTISLSDVQIFQQHMVIKIVHFKHNLSRQPLEILVKRQPEPEFCPVYNLLEFLKLRGTAPGPLFVFPNGKVVPRTFFAKKLKHCLNFLGLSTDLYKSHSFRIGSASLLASMGLSDSQIRLLGRWKSDAFKKYIRCARLSSCLS